jgi:hypothetical protein
MSVKSPSMTHAQRTIIIAKVCKLYNARAKNMTSPTHKTREEKAQLEAFLRAQCLSEGLIYIGMKHILLINY